MFRKCFYYKNLIAIIIVFISVLISSEISANFQSQNALDSFWSNSGVQLASKYFPEVNKNSLETRLSGKRLILPLPESKKVKGIFITGWVAGLKDRMEELIELANDSEINAFVIDIKDDTGMVSYQSNVPLVNEIGANRKKIKDIQGLIKKIKQHNIYLIGRIVVFKDPLLARTKEELALELINKKSSWLDQKWVDPNKEETWAYTVALAKEAMELGFDEIQFDYVRFPALGNGPVKIANENNTNKEEVINNFLSYAREQLKEYNIPISADIFGAVTSVNHDLGIGQKLETISQVVDIISPMVYPSHFAQGVFDLPVPEAAPYETIYNSMKDAKDRLSEKKVRIRPWLQDFSLKHFYGSEEVRKQIQALNDLGIEEWLLWNPRSRYTKTALLAESRNQQMSGVREKIE